MPEELALLLDGEHVATLIEVGMSLGCALTYTAGAVAKYGEGTLLLSVGLPVAAETYGAVDTKYFLDGLLPESHVRIALADRARVAEADTFGLLKAYGVDCAGAIQLVPFDSPDRRVPHVVWLSPEGLDEAVKDLPSAPLGIAIESGVRSSLGGLQSKLPLVVDGDRMGVPADGMPSTHILKPVRLREDGSQEWEDIVAAEAFGMSVVGVGHDLGLALRAAVTKPVRLLSRPALLVTRFDRVQRDGQVRGSHQEDAAQALQIAEKYQKRPDLPPRLADIAGLLQRVATVPATERRALLEWTVINAVLGNCDGHARNISLELHDGQVRLTPTYDVVPTAVWENHDRELALRIGGESMLDDLQRQHFIDEADSWGLRQRAAVGILDRTLLVASGAIDQVEARMRHEGHWAPMLDSAVAQARARIQLFSI